MPSNIVFYMNGVETLGGNNFGKWKQEIMFILVVMDRDESFHEERPVAPTANGDMIPPCLNVLRSMKRPRTHGRELIELLL